MDAKSSPKLANSCSPFPSPAPSLYIYLSQKSRVQQHISELPDCNAAVCYNIALICMQLKAKRQKDNRRAVGRSDWVKPLVGVGCQHLKPVSHMLTVWWHAQLAQHVGGRLCSNKWSCAPQILFFNEIPFKMKFMLTHTQLVVPSNMASLGLAEGRL